MVCLDQGHQRWVGGRQRVGPVQVSPLSWSPWYWRVRNELLQWLSYFFAVELFQMKTCSLKYRAIT